MKTRSCNSLTGRTLLLPGLVLIIFSQNSLFAAENSPETVVNPANIESILEGFDDTKPLLQTDESVDQVLDGFNESAQPQTTSLADSDPNKLAPSIFDSKNSISLSTVYNFAHDKPAPNATDFRGLSKVKWKLQSELTAQIAKQWKTVLSFFAHYDSIYEIKGRSEYSSEVLDSFESEAELLDTYVQGSLAKSMDIKFGRQIIAWGNSENVRVVDILNPLDLRELGMTDISDLRLPVTAAKIDYYTGKWNLSLIAIPEIRFNKVPPYGSDYYPGTQPPAPADKIEDAGSNSEYAVALKGIFHGWDLSFYWADYYDNEAHHEMVNSNFMRAYSRLKLNGVSANGTSGNWLLKSEFAKISGLEFFSDPNRDYTRFDILLGFEYSGIQDAVLSAESVMRRIDEYRPSLAVGIDRTERDSYQTVLRYTGSFLNDRLDLNIVGSFYGKDARNGHLYRISTDYEMLDSLVLTLGLVTYHSGDEAFFQFIQNNDRIFLDLTYNF